MTDGQNKLTRKENITMTDGKNRLDCNENITMPNGKNILTHSRMACAKTCLRKHWYAYEQGFRKDRDTQPLRMGRAFRRALELIGKAVDVDAAISEACADYETPPAWCILPEDQFDYAVEGEIVRRMIAGYVNRWGDEAAQIETVAAEIPFDLPLTNPATDAPTPIWRLGGMIARIVRSADGRLLIGEIKTAGEDLNPDSDYWERLQMDQQISLYTLAARQIGYDVAGILCDVARKPLIRPRRITKAENAAIESTGLWYGEHGEAGPRETVRMYGARLAADMAERPDWYFTRREIPRIESDIREFRRELWQMQGMLRDCQRTGRRPRNTAACLRPCKCEYWELCTGGHDPESGETPEGFKQLEFVHPELQQPVAAE